MNTALWGQHREIAPFDLTYGKLKPGSFVQRKRGNNLHLPLPIHTWLMIIQSLICNSLSHVCERKHETEGFLPPTTPGQIKSIPLSCTSAKALPSSVENQYNKERGEKYLQHGRLNSIDFHQTFYVPTHHIHNTSHSTL